jgi:alkylglycerol monooxygenase
MEQYGKILVIAMPLFLLLIIIEKMYGFFKGEDNVPLMDALASISSGITNAVKDVLGLSITFISYEWMVNTIAIFHLQANIFSYIIAFIVIDFYGYWNHRWAHKINFFWNKHVIHHSSEEFNLACALRQSISSFVSLFGFLLIPAAIVGVPAKVVAIVLPIQLFLQFWYHTRHIKKLGFLEKILVTPSHHRVHHALNPEYMDKNLSQIFILWDKLFGTFQEELDSLPPVYGITRPAQTWNPIRINFQHIWLLFKDAWRSKSWKDKCTIWFKPTGWRPDGFEEKYPKHKITDVYHFNKYNAGYSMALKYWSIAQVLITLFFLVFLCNNIATIGLPNIFIYGLFIFITVYSYTELMDKNWFSIFWEGARLILGLAIIFYFGDWFGLNKILSIGNYLVMAYLIISFVINFYFFTSDFRNSTISISQ